jgi:hypothetical protein
MLTEAFVPDSFKLILNSGPLEDTPPSKAATSPASTAVHHLPLRASLAILLKSAATFIFILLSFLYD